MALSILAFPWWLPCWLFLWRADSRNPCGHRFFLVLWCYWCLKWVVSLILGALGHATSPQSFLPFLQFLRNFWSESLIVLKWCLYFATWCAVNSPKEIGTEKGSDSCQVTMLVSIESVIETAEFPLKFASWTGLQLQLPFPEAGGGGVVKLEWGPLLLSMWKRSGRWPHGVTALLTCQHMSRWTMAMRDGCPRPLPESTQVPSTPFPPMPAKLHTSQLAVPLEGAACSFIRRIYVGAGVAFLYHFLIT